MSEKREIDPYTLDICCSVMREYCGPFFPRQIFCGAVYGAVNKNRDQPPSQQAAMADVEKEACRVLGPDAKVRIVETGWISVFMPDEVYGWVEWFYFPDLEATYQRLASLPDSPWWGKHYLKSKTLPAEG